MKRLKIGICLLCAVWLILTAPCFGSEFSIECDCNQSPCACYLQFGDKGAAMRAVIALLREKGYLQDEYVAVTFTECVHNAVHSFQREYQLTATGLLDDITLTWLIFDCHPLDLQVDAEDERPAWVSSNGGQKCHETPTCSGLISPRKITVRNAKAMELMPCETCQPYIVD